MVLKGSKRVHCFQTVLKKSWLCFILHAYAQILCLLVLKELLFFKIFIWRFSTKFLNVVFSFSQRPWVGVQCFSYSDSVVYCDVRCCTMCGGIHLLLLLNFFFQSKPGQKKGTWPSKVANNSCIVKIS